MVLKRQKRAVLAAVLGLFAVTGRAPAAQPASSAMPYCISADRVAAVLATRGISVQANQVEFLASVKSSRPDPELEIEPLLPTSRASVLARLHCHNAGECLPFLVVLHLSGNQDRQAMLERLPATEGRIRTTGGAARPNWTLKTGQKATFVLEGKDVRATTPVICLENGRQGESIRVSSLDRKRVMVGEIVGPGLLRGAL